MRQQFLLIIFIVSLCYTLSSLKINVNKAEASDTLPVANVVLVKVRGIANSYSFSVEIESPDKGCSQYADWWEVLSEDGKLIYRRILAHSHADEQPFIRSGGPVKIDTDTIVWIRAHMHPGGYGGAAFKGSVKSGFKKAPLSPQFAADLAKTPPLPDGCDF